MFTISHNDAIKLEWQVRRLYKCDRAGVSGLADADWFERRPLVAAYLVVAYIHSRGMQITETQYAEFLCKYKTIFEYPEENDAAHEVKNYVDEITKIVDLYVAE